ncbi:hypothetical protein ACFRAQ_36230 [Nocardia sp. NPDC056611]|uniref:hypothetical protein n=1 Tax=Nocardia sp. NPDC056611 TaxID=3345877 RepID=UPI00366D93D7
MSPLAKIRRLIGGGRREGGAIKGPTMSDDSVPVLLSPGYYSLDGGETWHETEARGSKPMSVQDLLVMRSPRWWHIDPASQIEARIPAAPEEWELARESRRVVESRPSVIEVRGYRLDRGKVRIYGPWHTVPLQSEPGGAFMIQRVVNGQLLTYVRASESVLPPVGIWTPADPTESPGSNP